MRSFCEKMCIGIAAVCFGLPALAQPAQIGGMSSVLFPNLESFGPVNGGMILRNPPLALGETGGLEFLPTEIEDLNLSDLDVSAYLERSRAPVVHMRRDLRDIVAAAAALSGTQVLERIEPSAEFLSVAETLLNSFQNNAFVRIEVLPFGFQSNQGGSVNGLYRIERDDGTSFIVTTLTGPNGEPIIISDSGQREFVNASLGENGGFVYFPFDEARPCEPTMRGDLQKSCYDQVVRVSWANGSISESGSGVIIHPEYMLTAAHVVSYSPADVARGRDVFVYQYRNRVKHRLQVRGVEVVPNTDLAVLRLLTPIDSENRTVVSPLLDGTLAEARTTFSVAGYGILKSGISVNDVRWGLFDTLRFPRDQDIFGGVPVVIEPVGRASLGCKSDSGAPAFASISVQAVPQLAVIGLFLGRDADVGGNCSETSRFLNLTNPSIQKSILQEIRDMGDKQITLQSLSIQLD